MKITVKKAIATCSIQDSGRIGWRSFGVPASGAADVVSFQLANFLVGNASGAPALEMAGGVFQAQVEQAGWLAQTGAGGQLFLNGKASPSGALVFVPEKTLLEIRPGGQGVFSYLAAAGGWDVPEVLGSASTCLAGHFGGLEGRLLQAGDRLHSKRTEDGFSKKEIWASHWQIRPDTFIYMPSTNVVRTAPGIEMNLLSPEQIERFFAAEWRVSPKSNRMGIRLEGPPLHIREAGSMWSAGVVPGTVQLPPDGLPVVLAADAQTIGGYPRIASVYAVDLPKLAQIPAGRSVRFLPGDWESAEMLLSKQEKALKRIQSILLTHKTLSFPPGTSPANE